MADLTGQTPAATYKGLLQVNDYTDGVDATAKYIQDGEGTNSALAISTDSVGIGTTSPGSYKLNITGGNLRTEGVVSEASSGANIVLENSSSEEPYLKFDGRNSTHGLNWTFGIVDDDLNDEENLLAVQRYNDASQLQDTPLVIDSDGNVGIGTANPLNNLHVFGNNDTGFVNGRTTIILAGADSYDSVGAGAGINFCGLYTSDGQLTTFASIHTEPENPDGTNYNGSLVFGTRATGTNAASDLEKMRITSAGNVGIGTTSFGTNAAGVIGIANATAPTSSPADMVQLYAEDVTASSELRVRDEAGNVTTLSPHAKDAPDSLYDNGKGVDEMHRVANHYLGVITFTNVDRRNDLMQKQLNGEELPEDRTFKVTETFAEYNARTGADLQVEDWDANQQAMFDAQEEKVAARQAEIDAWDNEEEEAPEPLQSYVKKPKPDWLS